MLEIIYKDTDIVIIRKPYGLDCQYQIPQFLKQQLNCDIYTVHRLDTIVTGVMVFCLNQKSAAILSKEITEKVFKKERRRNRLYLKERRKEKYLFVFFNSF